jgi:hypothetical protein
VSVCVQEPPKRRQEFDQNIQKSRAVDDGDRVSAEEFEGKAERPDLRENRKGLTRGEFVAGSIGGGGR